MTVYLDCNATSPIEPRVADLVTHYMVDEFGNSGSRTHEFGLRAKRAVQKSREQVAAVIDAEPVDVIFTSGATESNNLALLGLANHGMKNGRKHIVSTSIEHKAVLEPLEVLEARGFEVTLVEPTKDGWVPTEAIIDALRDNTLIVSVMHVNNETGVIQPIGEIADVLKDRNTYFHVDAAQGFGKELDLLKSDGIDLISISGHKVYGPKGIGALIARSRNYSRPPLSPIMFGGGQELGLRPGTLPVPLIAGLGLASEIALKEHKQRTETCLAIRDAAMSALAPLHPQFNGDVERTLSHVLNISFPGADSEAVMVALKGVAAVSNGSACTSEKYEPSHVLQAMGLDDDRASGAVRLSWCHLTSDISWKHIAERISNLIGSSDELVA